MDLLLCLVALAVAYLLRFNFRFRRSNWTCFGRCSRSSLLVRLVSFLMAGIHAHMVRHTNTEDARRIFLTVLGGSLAFVLIGAYCATSSWMGTTSCPFSVITSTSWQRRC